MYGSATDRRLFDIGISTDNQMSPEKTAAYRNPCRT
jgi:hypothetical protein